MYPACILGLGFNVNSLVLSGEDDEDITFLFQPAFSCAARTRVCAWLSSVVFTTQLGGGSHYKVFRRLCVFDYGR